MRSIVFCLLLCLLPSGASERPNIIFIFADDWGWGDLSCHNHPYVKTPHIDRLAKEGADFHNFTVASPVCSPSRVAVMTGHFPARYNIDGHFGKWHLSNNMIPDAPAASEYGFDSYGTYNNSGEQMPYDHDVTLAIKFISEATLQKKPFFINLWIHEPHTPFHVPPMYRQRFPELKNPGDNIYAATLSYADERIGQLLNYLDQHSLSSETIVIFSSDNGPARSADPQHPPELMYDLGAAKGITAGRKGYKASLHQGGINIPFLIRWPGKIEAGI